MSLYHVNGDARWKFKTHSLGVPEAILKGCGLISFLVISPVVGLV